MKLPIEPVIRVAWIWVGIIATEVVTSFGILKIEDEKVINKWLYFEHLILWSYEQSVKKFQFNIFCGCFIHTTDQNAPDNQNPHSI